MKFLKNVLLFTLFSGIICTCNVPPQKELKSWSLESFVKVDSINPILQPKMNTEFLCPVRGSKVKWEGKDVFNPAAIVNTSIMFQVVGFLITAMLS